MCVFSFRISIASMKGNAQKTIQNKKMENGVINDQHNKIICYINGTNRRKNKGKQAYHRA